VASLDDAGRIKGSKVTYHAERALEAIRMAAPEGWLKCMCGGPMEPDETLGGMLDTLAYDHARGAARAALNRTRRTKR